MVLHAAIFPPLSFLAWWNALFIAIYPLSSLFRHTVSSPAEERLFGGCQSRPIIRWQSICCCWSGMSNGITTVLITIPHTCTPPCATHLIAPRRVHPCYRPWYLLMPHFPPYGMSITGSDLYLCLVSVVATFLVQGVVLVVTGGEGLEFEQLFSAASAWTCDIRL